MGTRTHISRWGGSLAIRIPKPIAEQWGVQEGSPVEILPDGNHVVLRKTSYDLDEMLSSVAPGILHPETETGPPQGAEIW